MTRACGALLLLIACDGGAPAPVTPVGGVGADAAPGDVTLDTRAATDAAEASAGEPDAGPADAGPDAGVDAGAPDADDGADVPPPPECTDANADYKCNDNLPCTIDACIDGVCTHTEKAACCLADADCDDGIDCTIDECSPAHDCLHTFTDSLCCLEDGDCADQDECTSDLCVANQCVHPRAGADCPCLLGADCDDGNPCTADSCSGGACSYSAAQAPGCCGSAADCPKPQGCAVATCVEHTCATAPADSQVVWSATFDDASLSGFTVEDDGSGAKWQLGTTQAVSLPSALYFGRVPEYDYELGVRTMGTALSPAITSPAAASHTLDFWIAPNVEALFSVDKVWVELRPDGGAPVVLWSKDQVTEGSITGWKHVQADVTAWADAPFRVAFLFDSVDGTNNHYEGAWVDDVELRVPCQ